jgi:hypothetical protein
MGCLHGWQEWWVCGLPLSHEFEAGYGVPSWNINALTCINEGGYGHC